MRQLMPLVYDELRRLAQGQLRRERVAHTLQPTALVHEAYLRVIDQDQVDWESRAHFLAIAAKVMRQVLIDHARRRGAQKRGGEWQRITIGKAESSQDREEEVDLIALDDALKKLAEMDERKSRVVELRFFGGLSMPEVATALNVSQRTAEADWYMARAWLRAEIEG